LTAQNYWTILSGAGAHGVCATFEVWVEAFGAELFFYYYFNLDRSFPEEPERVILKQTPPYNLYGVVPLQPFLPATAE
jgi:hypothetical protein